jgi:hypothetical protein
MSTRGTHQSSLRKPIQTDLDFRSDYKSAINARARRVAILDGFAVHCEIITSILSSDNSDGHEKTGREKQRVGSSEEERSTTGLVCQTAKRLINFSISRR